MYSRSGAIGLVDYSSGSGGQVCVCDVCVRSGGRERKADEIQPYDVRGRSVGVGETRPTRLAAREPKIKFKMHHSTNRSLRKRRSLP